MRQAAALLAVLLAASSALAVARVRLQEPAASPAVTKQQATGRELFDSAGCAHCHMIDGAGGKKGPNLSGVGRRWKNQVIRKQIEEGSMEMPAFREVLSEPDLTTLVTYLHTRRAAEPKKSSAPPRPRPDPS